MITNIQAQQVLKSAGYYSGAIDGDFGVKSWQAVNECLSKAKVTYSQNDKSRIMAVQQSLSELGFDCGIIDGIAGIKTTNALNAYTLKTNGSEAWHLNAADELKLKDVKPNWIKIVNEAIKIGAPPFRIVEGIRSVERQKQLVKQGASQTMRSRHLTGDAIDIAPLDPDGQISWAWPQYYKLEPFVKQAAKNLNIKIEWGGDWKSFKDGPHWQFPW